MKFMKAAARVVLAQVMLSWLLLDGFANHLLEKWAVILLQFLEMHGVH